MNVMFVSTWSIACGIATYTKRYEEQYKNLGHQVLICSELDSLSIVRFAVVNNPDVIHFQHEFGLFPDKGEFISLCGKLRTLGFKVFVTVHTEDEKFLWQLDGNVDGVLLHNDVFNFSKFNLLSRYKQLYHPCPNVRKYESMRKKLGIPEGVFVIGTCGYVSSTKRIEYIIEGISDFVSKNDNVFIHLATSKHRNDSSDWAKNVWQHGIEMIALSGGWRDRLIINVDFMDFDELYGRLQTMDLAFVYAPPEANSNSGVLADIVGNGVPCVVNKAKHFDHIKVGKYECDNIPDGIIKLYYDQELYNQVKNSIKGLLTYKDASEIILNWY